MANEDQKDFNVMLNEDKGMPKMQIVTDEATMEQKCTLPHHWITMPS